MSTHTLKAFDVDLEELARMVAEMGGLAEKEIADSIMALARRDLDLAQRVIALDPSVDALQRAIEEKAILAELLPANWHKDYAPLGMGSARANALGRGVLVTDGRP